MKLTSVVAGVLGLVSQLALADFKVGLVLDKGGRDDKSFNAAAFAGLERAKKELKITTKVVEANDDTSFEPMLRAFVEKNFDLVISIGFAQADAVRAVAKANAAKKTKFAIVDADVSLDAQGNKLENVRSLLFEEHEGSFLAGVAAALKSTSGKIGFIGGMDIPLIRRFELGYRSGAKHVNPKIEVISNYIGVTGDSWNNPPKARELALAQFQKGADVTFAAAGASNSGLFDAAEEKKKLAIGCDSNQNWIKPGTILTSMLKRVDEAVFSTTQDFTTGKFTSGVIRYGLANQGVDLAFDAHNEKLFSASQREKIQATKQQILAKKIQVPDFYLKSNQKSAK